MNYLSAEGLTKAFGEKLLFRNLNIGLQQGQKAALVAKNGAGKTSLMRMLGGLDKPDSGSVHTRHGIRTAYLEQDPRWPEGSTILEALFAAEHPMQQAIRQYEACLLWQETHGAEHPDLHQALELMENMGAWDFEARVKEILDRLGIRGLDRQVNRLSGGQRKRVALAAALIGQPDLLLMDEPTNHLDLDMIQWLEGYLTTPSLTLLVVTHDRYFLDAVCNMVFELDGGQVYTHQGNYATYLERKQERMDGQDSEVAKAKNLMRKELEWMRRQPKARGTKSRAREDAFYALQDKASQKRVTDELKLEVKMTRIGGKILELKNLSHKFGEDTVVLKNFTYTFKPGDRIGLVGRNGTGKTSFLEIITSNLAPDAGSVVPGDTIVFGYYRQSEHPWPAGMRVIDAVKAIAEVFPLADGTKISASQMLRRFLFPDQLHFTPVENLSGGERRRLYLLTVLMTNPNFLILDEPTNDLDLPTLNVLEEFLEAYPGVLVMVSHDRYFMDRLVDHLFVFSGDGRVEDFNGNYMDWWLESRERMTRDNAEARSKAEKAAASAHQAAAAAPAPEKAAPGPDNRKRLSNWEAREYQELDKEIPKLEEKKEALAARMAQPGLALADLEKLAREMETLVADLERKTDRWLTLAEMAE